jgi:ADP-ribose pyrophosphatase YjhB (NUDIX family)
MNQSTHLLTLAKRIQALSENGQHYAQSDYDLDRYQEMEKISIEMISMLTSQSIERIQMGITEKEGYRTPKVDVRAVVFNTKDQVLMVREKVDGNWSLPGGWADIGFTPAEIAVKETLEEAGAQVKAGKLLGVFDKKCHDHPPDLYYAYKIFIECELVDERLKTGFETSDAGFFSLSELPPLSTPRNTIKQIEIMFSFHQGDRKWPYIDLENHR